MLAPSESQAFGDLLWRTTETLAEQTLFTGQLGWVLDPIGLYIQTRRCVNESLYAQ